MSIAASKASQDSITLVIVRSDASLFALKATHKDRTDMYWYVQQASLLPFYLRYQHPTSLTYQEYEDLRFP